MYISRYYIKYFDCFVHLTPAGSMLGVRRDPFEVVPFKTEKKAQARLKVLITTIGWIGERERFKATCVKNNLSISFREEHWTIEEWGSCIYKSGNQKAVVLPTNDPVLSDFLEDCGYLEAANILREVNT